MLLFGQHFEGNSTMMLTVKICLSFTWKIRINKGTTSSNLYGHLQGNSLKAQIPSDKVNMIRKRKKIIPLVRPIFNIVLTTILFCQKKKGKTKHSYDMPP